MRWVPHDDEREDFFYYYDKQNRVTLVDEPDRKRTNVFSYKGDQLEYVVAKKNDKLIDSTIFSYNEKGLNIGFKRINKKNMVQVLVSKKYNDQSQLIQEEHDYIQEKDNTHYLSTITYWDKEKEAERKTLMYINGKLEETWEYVTDINGIPSEWSCTYPTGKKVSYYSIIYKK